MSKDKSSLFGNCWVMLAPQQMPSPVAEYRFAPPRKWRFDWAFPMEMVAVEVEGNAWRVPGGGRHMQDSDLNKYNHAAALGWRVLRFSPGMFDRDPKGCVDLVIQALDKGRVEVEAPITTTDILFEHIGKTPDNPEYWAGTKDEDERVSR
jgi:very-short-patch-repair endonuclease